MNGREADGQFSTESRCTWRGGAEDPFPSASKDSKRDATANPIRKTQLKPTLQARRHADRPWQPPRTGQPINRTAGPPVLASGTGWRTTGWSRGEQEGSPGDSMPELLPNVTTHSGGGAARRQTRSSRAPPGYRRSSIPVYFTKRQALSRNGEDTAGRRDLR